MKLKDLLSHLVGFDYAGRYYDQERFISESTGREHVLPIQCGLSPAVTMYALRAREMLEHPFVLLTRWTGLDYAYNRIRKRQKMFY
ncbi:MAG: hypothetical protein KJ709_05475 [Nanoarchaeota archaeon]|nr:hypothetical protein [Nanoarchaeota archaeon]